MGSWASGGRAFHSASASSRRPSRWQLEHGDSKWHQRVPVTGCYRPPARPNCCLKKPTNTAASAFWGRGTCRCKRRASHMESGLVVCTRDNPRRGRLSASAARNRPEYMFPESAAISAFKRWAVVQPITIPSPKQTANGRSLAACAVAFFTLSALVQQRSISSRLRLDEDFQRGQFLFKSPSIDGGCCLCRRTICQGASTLCLPNHEPALELLQGCVRSRALRRAASSSALIPGLCVASVSCQG